MTFNVDKITKTGKINKKNEVFSKLEIKKKKNRQLLYRVVVKLRCR